MLLTVSVFSQNGYPKMIVSNNGDTCALISQQQYMKSNKMYVENLMFSELIDSLLVNDSLRMVKEDKYISSINVRDQIIENVELMYSNCNHVNVILEKQLKKTARKNKRQKLFIILEGVIIGFLIITH